MKKVVILSASPRKGGNSDILCHQFMNGSEEAGNQTELISLYDKNIGFCRACYACFNTGKCVLEERKRANKTCRKDGFGKNKNGGCGASGSAVFQ